MIIGRRLSRHVGAFLVALSCGACPATAAEEAVHWRMNSLLYPKVFGEAADRFADSVRILSGGSFDITVHDRLVYDEDTFAALDKGLFDAVWGSAGHHHREDPSLALFTGFPFISDLAEFSAWMRHGGGQEHLNTIYARHGLVSIYCGILPPESGGWFVEEIGSGADLEGLRMRIFGLGGQAARKLGVMTYELPAAEVKPALESRTIDAAEFSLPSIDRDLGLDEVAPHLYMPGWQQPVTTLEVLLPLATYARLSDRQKAVLETACGDSIERTAAMVMREQIAALEALRASGVTIHRWPDEVLDLLEQAWADVVAEESARDAEFAAAWRSYVEFRDSARAYRALAYPD